MRKTAAALITALLITAAAGTLFVRMGKANPYLYHESGPPPEGVTPLAISISSPKNNTLYRTNNITFTFSIKNNDPNAQFPSRESHAIPSVHYLLDAHLKADWMENNVTIYKQGAYDPERPTFWEFNETLWNIPNGEHSVAVTALGGGSYAKDALTAYSFQIATISVINFTVDASPPEISNLSPLNATYYSSEIPLNFNVNDEPSKISYSLDGQKNSTISGNTTLTHLPNGEHKLIVYVWDAAGNIGVSETKFKVEPFTTVLVAAASGASIVGTICCGLLLFVQRKRRKEAPQK